MKQCASCGAEKPLSEFYVAPERKPATECNDCASIRNRKKKLKQRYNISLEDYNELYDKQAGCCALCGTHQSELSKSLAVDHCHSTGKVRGLLCFDCNTGIGKLKDDYNLVYRAAEYLRSFKD